MAFALSITNVLQIFFQQRYPCTCEVVQITEELEPPQQYIDAANVDSLNFQFLFKWAFEKQFNYDFLLTAKNLGKLTISALDIKDIQIPNENLLNTHLFNMFNGANLEFGVPNFNLVAGTILFWTLGEKFSLLCCCNLIFLPILFLFNGYVNIFAVIASILLGTFLHFYQTRTTIFMRYVDSFVVFFLNIIAFVAAKHLLWTFHLNQHFSLGGNAQIFIESTLWQIYYFAVIFFLFTLRFQKTILFKETGFRMNPVVLELSTHFYTAPAKHLIPDSAVHVDQTPTKRNNRTSEAERIGPAKDWNYGGTQKFVDRENTEIAEEENLDVMLNNRRNYMLSFFYNKRHILNTLNFSFIVVFFLVKLVTPWSDLVIAFFRSSS